MSNKMKRKRFMQLMSREMQILVHLLIKRKRDCRVNEKIINENCAAGGHDFTYKGALHK